MPTQIFFDAEGNEFWRHEGFLAKETIVEKLREMGVSPPDG
jgi:thioredoxin 1